MAWGEGDGRFFNTKGPCREAEHHALPPGQRLPDLLPFVGRSLSLVVHAARQTGKTTAVLAFAARRISARFMQGRRL